MINIKITLSQRKNLVLKIYTNNLNHKINFYINSDIKSRFWIVFEDKKDEYCEVPKENVIYLKRNFL